MGYALTLGIKPSFVNLDDLYIYRNTLKILEQTEMSASNPDVETLARVFNETLATTK